MSIVYERNQIIIGLEGIDEVERILGNIKNKTPAVAKVALNSTARYTRKEMVKHAKARYAVNAKGRKHLDELSQKKHGGKVATNKDLTAILGIKTPRNDLGYFKTSPSSPFMGTDVFRGPKIFKGKVLKESGMKRLPGIKGKYSKAFLLKFANNGNAHIGMVQRVIGEKSDSTETRAGHPRWKSRNGIIESVRTLGAPSATAMHHTIWPEVEGDVEDYLYNALITRAYRVLELAEEKQKRR